MKKIISTYVPKSFRYWFDCDIIQREEYTSANPLVLQISVKLNNWIPHTIIQKVKRNRISTYGNLASTETSINVEIPTILGMK